MLRGAFRGAPYSECFVIFTLLAIGRTLAILYEFWFGCMVLVSRGKDNQIKLWVGGIGGVGPNKSMILPIWISVQRNINGFALSQCSLK